MASVIPNVCLCKQFQWKHSKPQIQSVIFKEAKYVRKTDVLLLANVTQTAVTLSHLVWIFVQLCIIHICFFSVNLLSNLGGFNVSLKKAFAKKWLHETTTSYCDGFI